MKAECVATHITIRPTKKDKEIIKHLQESGVEVKNTEIWRTGLTNLLRLNKKQTAKATKGAK